MKGKILKVSDLVSKTTGKPFKVLMVQDPETGLAGDIPVFDNEVYTVGQFVNLLPEVRSYKWQLKITK